ncbi:MAG: exodeoxyribonuclease VII small subunit [Treponema sp.]|nr:exodeoxyribonuclease VII small subunit [Treponema sp.]
MAKTLKNIETGKTLEDRLSRLELLSDQIRKPDITLDDALKAFDEGIKLARSLEKELEKIQNRIEILTSGAEAKAADAPELELFDSAE